MLRLVFTTFLALACATPTPSPTATPAPTARPSPTGTPSGCRGTNDATPGCTRAPEVTYQELPGPGTELDPGRYNRPGSKPIIGFVVGEGWTTVQQFPGFFDIQDDPGSLDVVAVQWTIATGFDTAESAAADIEARRVLTAGARQPVTIGGLSGIQIIVDTHDPADEDPPIFREVLNTPGGPLSIGPGRRLEVNLFTTNDGVVAILVGGSFAQWERAVQKSEPVLQSVVIGD